MIGHLTPSTYWFGFPPRLEIAPSSDTKTKNRRIVRTATLDGGAVFNDGGLSDADRTLRLTLRSITAEDAETLEQIAAYAPCVLSIDSGLFEGYVDSFNFHGPDKARLSFLVSRRII